MKILHREFLKTETPTCHASTIAFFKNKPIFSFFGGIREGLPDSSIYVQVGKKVHKLSIPNIPMWNPILFSYIDRLFLIVKAGLFCDKWNSILLDISDVFKKDFDITRVDKKIVPAGLNMAVKTKPIIHDGLIYCGASVETIFDWSSFIEIWKCDDEGKSLDFVFRTPPLTAPKVVYNDLYGVRRASLGIIQPSLWCDNKGHLNAFFRASRGLGKIYYSSSKDPLCQKWSNPVPTRFDNPNSGIDTVYMNDRLLLVYNPSATQRTPLVIEEINGETFETVDKMVVQEKVDIDGAYSEELSYPYIIDNEEELHLVYTMARVKIEHVVIGLE